MGYSLDTVAKALACYEAWGPAEAAREFDGKPTSRTITAWARRHGFFCAESTKEATEAANNTLAVRRARIREKLAVYAEGMLDRLGGKWEYVTKDGSVIELETPPASVCKDLATTAAILIDKFRLEAGEATDRSEVTVTDEDRKEVERDVARVIAEAEAAARDAAG